MTSDQRTAIAMGAMIGAALNEDRLAQAEFCRQVGVTPKHLNRVILGHAVATQAQLDYWAWYLGRRWAISLVRREDEQ